MKVEESTLISSRLTWFKSTYSSGAGGQCIEVATCPGAVRVRDSKNKQGARLAFKHDAWTDFVEFTSGI